MFVEYPPPHRRWPPRKSACCAPGAGRTRSTGRASPCRSRPSGRRYAEIAELFPIVKQRAKDRAASIFGGQQKLVEFARGMMLEPQLVLLDEPSMGLEPRILHQVFDTMREMCSRGRTILLVEQNARQGLAASHRGVVMESGRILLDGPAAEILDDERIGDLYLGGHVH